MCVLRVAAQGVHHSGGHRPGRQFAGSLLRRDQVRFLPTPLYPFPSSSFWPLDLHPISLYCASHSTVPLDARDALAGAARWL
eukprot:3298890-Rhodomonas_salina.6